MEQFNCNDTINRMRIGKNQLLHIIALYWLHKQYEFNNKEQLNAAIPRDTRGAKNLIGYSDESITKTMQYLDAETDFRWTLETVHKYIDEISSKRLIKPKGSMIIE